MISMSAMTPDLWLLAALVVACSLFFACFAIAEAQRFEPRHRRAASTSDFTWQKVRDLASDLRWKAFGLLTLGINLLAAATAASFPLVRPDRSVTR